MPELVVLGTASQVPTRHRNHNGYLLLWDGYGVLFDPGEGTQRQMIHAGVSASQISAIAITHFHGDHCLGLSGILQRISLDRVRHEVPVLYPKSGQKFYERLRRPSIYHDVAKIRPIPLEDPTSCYVQAPLQIHAKALKHTVDCWGFRVSAPPRRKMIAKRLAEEGIRGPEVGVLIKEGRLTRNGKTVLVEEVSWEKPGQSVAFVMDTRLCDEAVELARGCDLLIAESTYLSDCQKEATARGHMTATDAAMLAKRAGVQRLVLTHFSQRYQDVSMFEREAREIFPEVVAARDGDRVLVPEVRNGAQ